MRDLTNRKRKLIDKIWTELEEQNGGPATTSQLNAIIKKRDGGMRSYRRLTRVLRDLRKNRNQRISFSGVTAMRTANRLSPEHVEAINALWDYTSRKSGYSLPAEELIHYTHTEEGYLRQPHELRRMLFNLRQADEQVDHPQNTAMAF